MYRWGEGPRAASIGLALIVGGFAVGCTNDGPTAIPVPGGTETAQDGVDPAPNGPALREADAVEAAYERYLEAVAEAMRLEDPGHAPLARSAADQALTSARARVEELAGRGRVAGGGFVPTVSSVEVDGDQATVRDCYRVDIVELDRDSGAQVDDGDGLRFEVTARLERRDGSWTVVSFEEGGFCVPTVLASRINVAYVEFWDAVTAAGRPPDPDHPALAATATGEQLAGLRERLADFRDQGLEVRDASVVHPRVDEVFAYDTRAVVSDCRQLDPEGGVYDTETGELVQGGAEPGQRSLWRAGLELVDGTWKVVDVELVEEDSSCEPETY